jgi:ATP-dependent DNA helicase RecQ
VSWTDIEFVIFDLEANADRSAPPAHEIIEIGAVLVSSGAEIDAFTTLVRPTRPLRDITRSLTGITAEELFDAPTPAEALRAFHHFVDGRPVAAHNGAGYDYPLLDAAGAKAGAPMPAVTRLDTLELAHLAFPRAGGSILANSDGSRPPSGRSLDELARYFFQEEPRVPHRGLDDARLLLRVLPPLLRRVGGSSPGRRLQRWVLGTAGHPWSDFLDAETEATRLEDVVAPAAVSRRGPATGVFEPNAVAAMLDDGGALMGRARKPRRQQADMALQVAKTLAGRGRRLIEAPTGTGKTLAYLVPSIEFARSSGSTVVVAPHSKVLQDQIMSTLEELSGELEPFESVLLKGRSNYIDLEALAGELDALAENPTTFTLDTALVLAMLCAWVAQTPTGDWDDLRVGALDSGRNALRDLRQALSTEDPPGPPTTRLEELDFYRRARHGLRRAHVAVLNHALVVSDHEWRRYSKQLVLDEAHNLEDAATEALSLEVGRDDLDILCDALWDPQRRSGTVRRMGDAAGWPLRHDTAESPATKPGDGFERAAEPVPRSAGPGPGFSSEHLANGAYNPLGEIRRCVQRVRDTSARFGPALVEYLRVRTGSGADDQYPVSYRIRRGSDVRHPDYGEVLATGKQLVEALRGLAGALNEVNLPNELAGRYKRNRLEAEIARHGRFARDAVHIVDRVLWVADDDEQIAIGSAAHCPDTGDWTWMLKRSPLSVAGPLARLWDWLDAQVLTSATLRAGASFDHIVESLGLDRVETSVLGSPFPWIGENHLLVLTDYLPSPRSRLLEEFKASAATEVPRLLMLTRGRGLILMAARARMEFVRDHARPILDEAGIPLLAQGDDSAAALVERMRAENTTSLIALRSFWEGVDIPGDALSLLVIEKIPFDSPADPVAGARMEAIEHRGQDPYARYLVPRAALRFAQGVGRLIRTESDRGATVVLDSRLCRAVPYRDVILDTLPGPPRRVAAKRAEDAYRHITDHLGDIELNDAVLARLQAVESPDAWGALADLELSEADPRRPEVIAERLEQVRRLFGFRRWRPGQVETMRDFIKGRDVLAVLPTGSGKSITFQIPGLLSPGITLVVSPLKALMNDQAENLRARGTAKVAVIHSGVGQAEWRDVLRGAERGDYKLLYISPERLWSQEFVEALARVGVARIAVDEAHCISQWGHSFRPEYAAIPEALQRLAPSDQRLPVLAVTATANAAVRRDIVDLLRLDLPGDPVVRSPGRPEIRYLVEPCDDRSQRDLRVVQIVESFRSQPAIVYVPTRRDTVRIAGLLRAAGHIVRPYHGALQDGDRLHTEDAFRHGELDVVVATKAFGMGIDKPDIALVVHLEMPATIEEYVQETGRAARGAAEGREPAVGTAVLLSTCRDCSIHRIFIKGAAPGIEQVRRVWSQIRDGTHAYDPDDLDRADGSQTDQESVAVALAVHYLQDAGALIRHLDVPWRGRVSAMADTGARLEELEAEDRSLARRGRRLVELIDRLGTDEYRAEVWSEHMGLSAADVSAALLELNRRDILGFSAWKHAWTLERRPGAEPAWAVIEARAQERRGAVKAMSRQAKRFSKRQRGCRVRAMLAYFDIETPETCEQCDLCANLHRPWAGSHISREGLLESLPTRRITLQLLDETQRSGYSRRNLERTLVGNTGSGEHALPERLAGHHLFGRLRLVGAPGVTQDVDRLIEEGLIRAVSAEHDGTPYDRLEITDDGRAYLR